MASSSAGALRRWSNPRNIQDEWLFQWPLRRPGRCADTRDCFCKDGSFVSMASSSAGALRQPGRSSRYRRGFRFNGLFVGRGAAPIRMSCFALCFVRFNGLFVGRGAAPGTWTQYPPHLCRFNGLFVGRGAAPRVLTRLPSASRSFNGLFVGRGAAPDRWRADVTITIVSMASSSAGALRHFSCRFWGNYAPRVSMASSSAGALRHSPSLADRLLAVTFQWPLRRPGRCALGLEVHTSNLRFVSMASSSAGALRRHKSLTIGRRSVFQWPLRRPGRCACRRPVQLGGGWVSMASSSAGALRRIERRNNVAGKAAVSMASSSAGALRRGCCGHDLRHDQFQWPLRRPGRCAAISAGASPTRRSFQWPLRRPGRCAGARSTGKPPGWLFQWPLRRPGRCADDYQGVRSAVLRFNGLFVGRGAAPIRLSKTRLRVWTFQWPLRRPGRCAHCRPTPGSRAGEFQWPLRRPGRCANLYPCLLGFTDMFQWPLRRPGRCADLSQGTRSPGFHGFNGLFVGRGAAPGPTSAGPTSAGVSMASSSAGALRPTTTGTTNPITNPFQWPLRRPGRCAGAVYERTFTTRHRFQWPLRRPGRCAVEILLTGRQCPSGFNGLFVGRGAAPALSHFPS